MSETSIEAEIQAEVPDFTEALNRIRAHHRNNIKTYAMSVTGTTPGFDSVTKLQTDLYILEKVEQMIDRERRR